MAASKTNVPDGSWVLVTGATGFVGSHVTSQLLERGYKVRGTVRNLEQASWLVNDLFKSYAARGFLELHAVPDFAAEGAFDEAVKGVSAVAHIATVTTFDPDPKKVIPQTVASVTSLFKAALKEPSVRNVIFTSSIVAATAPVLGNNTHVERNTWNEWAVQAAWAPGPFEPGRGQFTYAASKVSAEKEVWKFVEENSPHFSVNVVNPSAIIGEPLHKKHTESSANWVGMPYNGVKEGMDPFPALFFVDVKDVALLHVACILDPDAKNLRLQAWGHPANWNDILSILRKLRPDRQLMPDYPDSPSPSVSTDQSASIALLKKWAGQDGWRSLESGVSDNIENAWYQ